MSYNLVKEKLGGVNRFIEDGTTFDDGSGGTLTVGKAVRPTTVVPEMNSVGCAIETNFESDTESDEITCWDETTDSYVKETDITVTADYIDQTIRDHSEPIYRMVWGIVGKIPTDGSPVIPFAAADRSVTGWIAFEGRSAHSKTQRALVWLRVKMTIKEYPGWKNETTIPVLRYQKLSSTLNSATFATNI